MEADQLSLGSEAPEAGGPSPGLSLHFSFPAVKQGRQEEEEVSCFILGRLCSLVLSTGDRSSLPARGRWSFGPASVWRCRGRDARGRGRAILPKAHISLSGRQGPGSIASAKRALPCRLGSGVVPRNLESGLTRALVSPRSACRDKG